MADTVQFRRDIASEWGKYNPVLLAGEIGIETDTHRFKLGDGVTNWSNLVYSSTTLTADPEDFLKYEEVVDITYNTDDIATSETYANGSKRLYTYNAGGFLSKEEVTDSDGSTVILTITYTYDANNRLKTITKDI